MKSITRYIAFLLIGGTLASCDNFEEINTNPDAATQATSSLLATGAILNIMQSGRDKNFVTHSFYSKQLAWGEGHEGALYNNFGRESFDGYTSLTNSKKMVELASENDKNAYEGLFYFLKAYKLYYISLNVGDIPYKEILEGEDGKITPAYSTQKEVMKLILADLDKAYELFSEARNFSGDPIFKGDVGLWKKTVTAFQLKVLINLSKKEADTDLNVKAKFAEVSKRPSLMTSNSDNFQLVYSDKEGQVYPFHYTQTKHAGYSMVSKTIIDELKKNEDYRLFYYAKPAKSKTNEGIPANSWEAYIGADPSAPIDVVKANFNSGSFCSLNARYTQLPAGEPLVRLGYAEQNFILAEAALRGWISADASVYYKKAIEASLRFISSKTPDDEKYHYGRKITDAVIASTLSNVKIQLDGTKEQNLEKIITQKYVASFLQNPYEAFYDYRRTGYPVLPINPGTNMNTEKDKIPVRWMYPDVEYSYNKANVEEAVKRQFGGVDEVNKVMWILE